LLAEADTLIADNKLAEALSKTEKSSAFQVTIKKHNNTGLTSIT